MKKIVWFVALMILSLPLLALTVHDIQYTTDTSGNSPYVGNTVSLQGVVTATGYGITDVAPNPKYFISDPEGGPWSGIYVYDFAHAPILGDLIQITGIVQEYYGFTEITTITSYSVLSSGNPIPQPYLINTGVLANAATAEPFEGVLVKVQNVSVSQVPNIYQEFYVNDSSGDCQIDNGFFFGTHTWTNVGIPQTWMEIRGIVDYSFNLFGINPRSSLDMNLAYDISNCALSIQSINCPADTTVSVCVYTSQVHPSVNLTSYSLRIGFDPTHVQYMGVSNLETLTPDLPTTVVSPGADTVYISWSGVTPISSAADGACLIKLNFQPITYGQTIIGMDAATYNTTNLTTLSDGMLHIFNTGTLSVHDIQYTTNANGNSPYNNQVVTVQGIVSGSGYSGMSYFITDATGGPWSGLYIFDPTNTPQVGDMVLLTGTVVEYYNMTELMTITAYSVISSGNALPEPCPISTMALVAATSAEPYEGVLVKVQNVLVTQLPNTTYDEFYVSDGSTQCQVDNALFPSNHDWSGLALNQPWQEIRGLVDYSLSSFAINPRNMQDMIQSQNIGDCALSIQTVVSGLDSLASLNIYTSLITPAMNVTSYSLRIGINPARVQFVGVDTTGTLTSAGMPNVTTSPQSDTVYIVWTGTNSIVSGINDFVLLKLLVTPVFLGDIVVGLDAARFNNANLTNLTDGLIDVQGSYAVTIHDIQYTTLPNGDSPFNNQNVTVQGIITGVGYNSGISPTPSNKFFISDPAGGPWNGVYVFDNSHTPVVGDLVQITATVAEYYNQTELRNVTAYNVISSGNPLPEPYPVSTSTLMSAATAEKYEGVLVKVQNVTVSTLPNSYNEFNVNDGTGVCEIDDQFFLLGHSWTGLALNQVWTEICGIVDYSSSTYAINPRTILDMTQADEIASSAVRIQTVSSHIDTLTTLKVFTSHIHPTSNLTSYSLRIGINPTQVQFAGIDTTGTLSNYGLITVTNSPQADTIYISWNGNTGIVAANNNMILLRLKFIPIASGSIPIGMDRAVYNSYNLFLLTDGAVNVPVGNTDELVPVFVDALYANYPNPFNPTTTLNYSIAKAGEVCLNIYNTKGQLVRTLVNAPQKAGRHSIVWDGKSDKGILSSSGIYYYRIASGRYSGSGKMILLK